MTKEEQIEMLDVGYAIEGVGILEILKRRLAESEEENGNDD